MVRLNENFRPDERLTPAFRVVVKVCLWTSIQVCTIGNALLQGYKFIRVSRTFTVEQEKNPMLRLTALSQLKLASTLAQMSVYSHSHFNHYLLIEDKSINTKPPI